jgi:hypothetical protein
MPKAPNKLPPAEYLHQCFEYDGGSGKLRWRHRPQEHFPDLRSFMTWNATRAGKLVVEWQKEKGHLTIGFNRKHWAVGRVIYKMHHLVDPDFIDHIDRNPQNNRLENLRNATLAENNRNKIKAVGASGLTGAVRHGRRFRAMVWIGDGKVVRLGQFDTAEEAHAAYREAANRIFGEFSPFRD